MSEKIHIDLFRGNDLNGNGSQSNPYKTLNHFLINIANKNNSNYEIKLGEGDYSFGEKTFSAFQRSYIRIIGQGMKTSLVQHEGINPNGSGVGYATTTVEFCKLIYKTTISYETINCNCFRWNWIMRNVAFKNIPHDRGAGYSTLGFFIPGTGSKLEFHNCVKVENTVGFLRTTNGQIKVYNSVGPFTSGYATKDSNWNIEGNLIQPILLDANFKVINAEHKGVHAGSYSWFINKNLICHNGEYKKIGADGWETVSNNLPTLPQFLSDDVDSLSLLLNRKLTKDEPELMAERNELLSSNEVGKLFSKTLKLKTLIDIRSVDIGVK